MRITQIAMLVLSMAGTTMAQSAGPHLLIPGQRNKFSGLSHIEVELGQRNTLLVGFDRYAQVQARQNVDSVLRLFVNDYRKIADTTQSPTRAIHAQFRLNEADRALDLRFTPQPTSSFRFRRDNPPLDVKTQQDTLHIVWASDSRTAMVGRKSVAPDAYGVYLLVNSFADLEDRLNAGGINGALKTAFESVRSYKGHDLTDAKMAFNMVQGTDKRAQFIEPGLAKAPFLSLQPGIGVGLIRNQWVPSLNFDIQFIPNRRRSVGYSIGYTSTFFFAQAPDNGSFQAFRNDFLSLGVAFYNSDKGDKATSFSRQIASFSVGMLVKRSGPYFERNTIRLSGTVYQKGPFKVQPELYMNGFFKKVNPGLRLVVGF
ncbi:hypothetical protein [Spirosoma utsteinense]|uniref:Porin n=1 Tax=Spirosoma utsteinense TaxID=2585773 RepID=A0ABR6W7C4_9BACT|nr:hypothetical protein [Spirosoma utsteinense]MBC3786201.1 hypothetical protein [Spirosoma utsteinense]MBC3792392.1 hypothetical protein [Spirosoma utsteinense]